MKNTYLFILFTIFYSYCSAGITVIIKNETTEAWDIDIFFENAGRGECSLTNKNDTHTFNDMPNNLTIKATAQNSNLTRGRGGLSTESDNIILSKNINMPDGKIINIYIRAYDCSIKPCPARKDSCEQGKNNICYHIEQESEMLRM